jgi:hypothetical protein
MPTLSDDAFRFLALCAQRPGSAAVADRLSTALSSVPSFDEVAIAAEQHGLDPLLLAHIDHAGLAIPADVRARLRARRTQHAHAAAVRVRMIADVVCAMAQAEVPFLVLKGAALAQLVYDDPRLRPMRDVDLLIRKADAGQALDVLMRCGFRPGGTLVPAHHHHLRGMARTMDGATVTFELHHELLARTLFVEPRGYDDLTSRSQPFEWGAMTCRTLGREDLLWHVYAHAFAINDVRRDAMRLLSVADLAHATEAWIDQIDWAVLRRRYARLLRALHVLDDLVPWSPHVAQVLREQVERPASAVRVYPIDSDPNVSAGLIPDVLWPPQWWFRMRYGITAWPRRVWFRVVGHPVHLALSAGRAVMTRLPRGFGLESAANARRDASAHRRFLDRALEDGRVDEAGDRGAGNWREPEEPELLNRPASNEQRGCRAARGIHRRVRHRDAD